ncbi:cyclin-dependent kinase inhibitor 4 [Morus notabilis]|uniref:cyclin-dependent kinase inhibitor 4 n=1 Tax=Morus notabilis TaxID=981085 RepID=UPI000CED69C1|nr:cyclin-dependent kinase inhibitor 4 [Morus notabilis]
MGKYMKKAKATGEVAVMEVSQSSLGVRTRAKTLALRKLQKSPSSAPAPAASSGGSYLQLRSRRLEKPPPTIVASSGNQEARRQRQVAKLGCAQNPNNGGANSVSNSSPSRASPRLRASHVLQEGSRESDSVEKAEEKPKTAAAAVGVNGEEAHGNGVNGDLGVEEASFGENVLEFEGRERSTRESTPCSLIRDPDIIRTPGSTTRRTNSAETNRRIQNSSQRHIPTAHEMDEFFAGAEVEQQKQFIDKYNFDPVSDKPLLGRYEWEKVDS